MSDFRYGDHRCLTYETEEERWQTLLSFMQAGIVNKEKVVYAVDDREIKNVKDRILSSSKDVFEKALATGTLVIISAKEAYYPSGQFDPAAMYQLIERLEQEALAQSYTGLRGCGEMSWLFDEDVPGSDKVVEYERGLKTFLQGRKICLLCLYDKNKFGPEMTDLMEQIHTRS